MSSFFKPSICCGANSLKTSTMAVSSFPRYMPLRLLQICINNNNNKNNILPVEVTRGTAESTVLKMHLLK